MSDNREINDQKLIANLRDYVQGGIQPMPWLLIAKAADRLEQLTQELTEAQSELARCQREMAELRAAMMGVTS